MKTKKAIVIIFFIILLAPTLTWPLGKLFLNPDITENKKPAEFPAFSDNFITEFETYFLDHAPYRNLNISLNSKIANKFSNIYYKILDKMNIPYYQIKNNVLFGEEGWLFYTLDDSLLDYAGTNLPSQEELDSYLQKAVKVNNYFKSVGKEFIIFIPPNKEQVYSEYMPDGIRVESETKRVQMITDYISQNSDVKIIYCLDDLKKEKADKQLYFKNDTHWNSVGGVYGTNVILKELGIEVGDITFTEIPSNFKDLANMALLDVATENDYAVQLSLPNGMIYDKKVTLVADSFGAFMTTPLSQVFAQISIDGYSTLYENIAFGIEYINSADIFILESVERYDQRIFKNGGLLDQLISYYGL